MKKDKNLKDDEILEKEEVNTENTKNDDITDIESAKTRLFEYQSQLEELKAQLEEKSKKCDEYLGMLQRTAAEFENYKKRTAKEKESLCSDAVIDVVECFLPVVDNMERAVAASVKDDDKKSLLEGIELVARQLKDVMKKLGVEELKSVGEKFDPQLHNAVMHIEDDSLDENVIAEEFQKGYILKDKVIRHSMVKVAN